MAVVVLVTDPPLSARNHGAVTCDSVVWFIADATVIVNGVNSIHKPPITIAVQLLAIQNGRLCKRAIRHIDVRVTLSGASNTNPPTESDGGIEENH